MTVKVMSWVFSSKKDRMYEECVEIFKNVKRIKSRIHSEDPGSSLTLIFEDGKEKYIITYDDVEIVEESISAEDEEQEIIKAYKEGRNPPSVQKYRDEHPEEVAHTKEVSEAYKRGETPSSVYKKGVKPIVTLGEE